MRIRTWLPALGLATLLAQHQAHAQTYPSRHVTIINQTAAGSGPDVVCRIVAERLTKIWGQQVTVINRQGAGGALAAQAAASAQPDGYTLFMPTSTSLVILPEINTKLGIDFARDFVPIGLVGETPMAVAVSAESGIQTLAQLISSAKSKPEGPLYAANARGSVPHLAGEYFRQKAGIQLTFVPHSGAPAALNEVLGGRIPIVIESLSALSGAAQDGSIKVLAVTSAGRLANLPEIPVVAETLPDFAVVGWFAMLAPAGVPEPIVRKVGDDLHAVLRQTDIKDRLAGLTVYPRFMSSAETAEFIRSERQLWKPIIKAAGLAPQ